MAKYSYNHGQYSDKIIDTVKKYYSERYNEYSTQYNARTAFYKAREDVTKQFHITVSDASSIIATKKKLVSEDVQLAFNF